MKKHPIPKITEEKWESIQSHLTEMTKIISKLETLTTDKDLRNLVERLSIHMGLLDIDLGRVYSLEELKNELKEFKKDYKNGKSK